MHATCPAHHIFLNLTTLNMCTYNVWKMFMSKRDVNPRPVCSNATSYSGGSVQLKLTNQFNL
jgi:hypothetical protein